MLAVVMSESQLVDHAAARSGRLKNSWSGARTPRAERTIYGLWNGIGRFLDLFFPQKSANYFIASGNDED